MLIPTLSYLAITASLSSAKLLDSSLSDAQIISAAALVNSSASFTSFLNTIALGSKPSSAFTAVNGIASDLNRSATNPIALVGLLRRDGLAVDLDPSTEQLSGCGYPCSDNNVNKREPVPRAYTHAEGDAPWSVPEAQLRAALYFPPAYSYGQKTPIVFIPGTGNYGKQSFFRNMGKKFGDGDIADPVYLNIPRYLLRDAQISAEYVAYAAKYISGVSKGQKVAVMTWSQGSVDTHWALKYWPSARSKVADVINISGDYKGFDSGFEAIGKASESLWQQLPSSKFLATLRADGGDSAYLPTTSIMSTTDNVVPQLGGPAASGYIRDARNVGVTNVFIQETCALQPGGVPYTHEGAMSSNLAFDLAVDAITHEGPGRLDRLNLAKTCSFAATEGLTALDVVYTAGATTQALYNILAASGATGEPLIKPYAA
ncbi:hypothetical protein LTR97_004327 [Elasticomyces elasticus]|uniref:Triacylglycerol lipase n=1 Tax=Elasticomyces elasticus TaxID=574655 RepID=A0AAN7WBQ2_9PEZI|nr:hypothetical protein LTR97_004327 [Elasticomyces elasticus]